ncbi:hypothetical protein H8K90_03555 [Winogradskyella echinorum]|uniref:Uncharacterized protein n=1 Tax=Winogradskyella echinorum TaxID=538189 RepID=A0ABR6XY88_9FLAO|nr:hypothetical protein [Winogradskyella echinorum]MBC3845446.1 hypothetical protein [Winogradskyella echinorum]MBC5749794.1 hypothetical protein [Winogradskyella echinorum]
MEELEFKYRLIESSKKLIEFTETLVFNSISKNIEYLIELNSRMVSNHLNSSELEKLKEINILKDKPQSIEQVISVLYNSGLVPLWINSEVYRSTNHKTIIRLICSRRFRIEEDLNSLVNKFPPFHIVVPLPPWGKEGVKFNVNWRHQYLKRKWYALIWKLKNRK